MTTGFHYRSRALFLDQVPVEKILKEVGTPAYLYSANQILESFQELDSELRKIPHLICFAMKANSNLSILNLLREAGAGFDLVSGGELFRAGVIQTPGEKIVFSGVGKTDEEISEALNYCGTGIFSFNVESLEELNRINSIAGQLGRTASVALRFNPNVNAKTHPYISTGLKKNKFGMDRALVLSAIQDHDLPHVRFKGLSIHIGSQILSLKPLEDAFKSTAQLFESLNKELLHPLEFIDLGGGLGIQYKKEKPASIKQYTKLILKHFGPKFQKKTPATILLEPGRSLVGSAGALFSEVLFRKKTRTKDFLIIDAGMNDLIRPALYQGYHEVLPLKKSSGKRVKTDVVGPVCETADCFASNRLLPESLSRGEAVGLMTSGAYGFVMASNYNSRRKPCEVLVEGDQHRVVRERETYSDLIRGGDCLRGRALV